MHSNVTKLFEEGAIGKLRLKNRIVMAAMGTGYCHPEGYSTPEYVAFMRERAKGGTGLLTTGVTRILSEIGMRPGSMGIYDDKLIPALRELVDAVHEHDARLFMQLHHSGTRTSEETKAITPSAPSAVLHFRTGVVPRALTIGEIEGLVDAYGQAARRAQDAGFDGVEVHGGHGYLICQFLSPRANRRTDRYGGSVLNRARFPIEIIQEIRRITGPDFPIIFRFSATEYVEGGATLEDSLEQVPHFVAAGADALHVSGGADEALQWVTPDFNEPPACLVQYAAAVKRITSVPVIAVGKLGDPIEANKVLERGDADFVALGRPLLADPYLPAKAKSGAFDDVLQCIYCNNGCTENRLFGRNCCAINPVLGQEMVYKPSAATRRKHVVVVGGGLAGMQTAVTAAERGHRVSLFEKADALGGQWIPATIAKPQIGTLTEYLSRQLARSGADVTLRREIRVDDLQALAPDAIVIGTGASQVVPPIPGAVGPNLVMAWDVLHGRTDTRDTVVVIGAGLTGSDTAYYLARRGKRVSLVSSRVILRDVERLSKLTLKEKLIQSGVYIYPHSTAESITPKGVNVINDGELTFIAGETVVIAAGVKPDRDLANQVAERYPDLPQHVIGDCFEPRTALEAIHEGFKVACEI